MIFDEKNGMDRFYFPSWGFELQSEWRPFSRINMIRHHGTGSFRGKRAFRFTSHVWKMPERKSRR